MEVDKLPYSKEALKLLEKADIMGLKSPALKKLVRKVGIPYYSNLKVGMLLTALEYFLNIRNLDSSKSNNSQHQSYGYGFGRVVIVTGRKTSPVNSPVKCSGGKKIEV